MSSDLDAIEKGTAYEPENPSDESDIVIYIANRVILGVAVILGGIFFFAFFPVFMLFLVLIEGPELIFGKMKRYDW
jgi:hypothetical protein